MFTPSHVAVALALYGNKNKPKQYKWIAMGGLLPDIPMFTLFVYELIIGTPQQLIWSSKYFTPLWQYSVDVSHSVFLYGVILVIAWQKKWQSVQLLCYAAFTHIVFDLFLHREDAHRHLFPLSDFQFISPVSYWDPNYYGHYWLLFEFVLLGLSSYIIFHLLHSKKERFFVLGGILVSMLVPLYFIITNLQ